MTELRILDSGGPLPEGRVIVPSRAYADGLPEGARRGARVQPIDAFVREHLEARSEDTEHKNQASLTLELGADFARGFPKGGLDLFLQALRLLMDFRGFTLDPERGGEGLDLVGGPAAEAAKFLWSRMDGRGTVDDHGRYGLVGDGYLGGAGLLKDEDVTFMGFNHLTAVQVDMIKAVGEANRTAVAVERYALERSLDTDWPAWFGAGPAGGGGPADGGPGAARARMFAFPKARLAETLDHVLKGERVFDVVLAQKEPGFAHCSEAAVGGASFAHGAALFEAPVEGALEEAGLWLAGRGGEAPAEALRDFLGGRLRGAALAGDFRRVKVLALLAEALEEWAALAGAGAAVGAFVAGVLGEAVRLRAPKATAFTASRSGGGRVLGIEGIRAAGAPAVLVASSGHAPLHGGEAAVHDQGVLEFLASMGPVRRGGFEALGFRKGVLDFLAASSDNILLVEDGLMESDPFWGGLRDEFAAAGRPLRPSMAIPSGGGGAQDHLGALPKKAYEGGAPWSATRLQTYRDCPRKFYYSYVERLPSKFRVRGALDGAMKGTVEHAAIRACCEGGLTEPADVAGVVEKELAAFEKRNGMRVKDADRRVALAEMTARTENGVRFVEEVRKKFSFTKGVFEKEIEQDGFTGRVDFVAKCPDGDVVLDFKRSAGAVPSLSAVQEHRHVQMPFYIHHLGLDPRNVVLAGFFCLGEPAESTLFHSFGKTALKDASGDWDLEPKTDKAWKTPDALERYPDVEEKLIQDVLRDTEFRAEPLSRDACRYCQVRAVCPRGALQ